MWFDIFWIIKNDFMDFMIIICIDGLGCRGLYLIIVYDRLNMILKR